MFTRIDRNLAAPEGVVYVVAVVVDLEPSRIAFRDIDESPDHRRIGNPEHHIAGHRAHAINNIALQYDPVARRG